MVLSAVGLAVLGFVAYLALGSSGAGPSMLSAGPRGWIVAREYLAARGVELEMPRSLEGEELGSFDGTLLTAFPWSPRGAASRSAFQEHLRRGGTLAIGYSGEAEFLGPEPLLLESLGSSLQRKRARPPLAPWHWHRHESETWELQASKAGGRPVVIGALTTVPQPPEEAVVLYSAQVGGSKVPVVFSFPSKTGTVLVFPAEAISNGRLLQPGNADLLEDLRRWLGDRWVVDELAHGLEPLTSPALRSYRLTYDLFLGHLLLLYLLAVLRLGRRFGRPWRETPARVGSAATFLLGLGGLHHRLGHHQEAAHRLLQRVKKLDPHWEVPDDVQVVPTKSGKALVSLARRVATSRRGEPRASDTNIEKDIHD